MSAVVLRRHRLALLAALLGGAAILRVVADGPTDRSADTTGSGGGAGVAADDSPELLFSMGGNADRPLMPGVMVPLDLAFTNPQDFALAITDLNLTVEEVRAPNADDLHPCGIDDYTVNQAAAELVVTVAAATTSTLSALSVPRETWPQVGLRARPVNQDGCKGATLRFRYDASGALIP